MEIFSQYKEIKPLLTRRLKLSEVSVSNSTQAWEQQERAQSVAKGLGGLSLHTPKVCPKCQNGNYFLLQLFRLNLSA